MDLSLIQTDKYEESLRQGFSRLWAGEDPKAILDEVASQFADASAKPGKLEASIDEQCGKGSLQRVFAALSENQRETLHLFFAEGYTFDEIATKLGQSRGNIKHHYFRALGRLRKALFGGKLPGD